MYDRILVAIDGSALAKKGLEQGLALARALGAEVTILTASDPPMTMGVDAAGFAVTEFALAEELEKEAQRQSNAVLAEAAAVAQKDGVPHKTVYVPRTRPADAIIDYAARSGIDLIVMASHGRRGVQRVLLGSQTNEVLTRSHIPVLVVR